eukprot:gene32609-42229_t
MEETLEVQIENEVGALNLYPPDVVLQTQHSAAANNNSALLNKAHSRVLHRESTAPVTRKPSAIAPLAIAPSATPTSAPYGPSIAPTDDPSYLLSAAPSKPTFTPSYAPSTLRVAPTTFPTGVAKLNVIILVASFAIKQNVPIRKSSSSCEVTGTHAMRGVLNLIIKLKTTAVSYPTFYSIQILNTVKTTESPKYYTCTSNNSHGISAFNYLTSHQYVAGQQYTVEVTVLPHNALLTAVSSTFDIKYTATDTRRRIL